MQRYVLEADSPYVVELPGGQITAPSVQRFNTGATGQDLRHPLATITQVLDMKSYLKIYWENIVLRDHYDIEWSDSEDFSTNLRRTNATGDRWWLNIMNYNLELGAPTQYFRIRGCTDADVCDPWSDTYDIAPQRPTLTKIMKGWFNIRPYWTTPFGDETSFVLEWSDSPEFSNILGSEESMGTLLSSGERRLRLYGSKLDRGNTYYYRLRSCWGTNICGFWSDTKSLAY